MSAEIAKLRYLQFPRWTAAAVVGVSAIAGILLLVLQPKSADTYATVPSLAVGVTYQIAAVVFGVWVATLEFSSGTLQRTLTAQPNRSKVLIAKLAVLVVGVAATGAIASCVSIGLSSIASSRAGVHFDQGDCAAALFSLLAPGIAAAVVGFGLGLLTRSMGGGVTGSLAVVFVLDGALGAVPGLKEWTFGKVSSDLQSSLSGQGHPTHSLLAAGFASLVWMALLTLPGWLSFNRGDLK
jgi:ABC-2 type transport system permease protein